MKTFLAYSLCVLMLVGCDDTSQDTGRSADDLMSLATLTEFGSGGLPVDTIAVAKTHGIDYKHVVAGCLKRDSASMHQLFWLSAKGGLDAASAQGHAAVVGQLFNKLGDEYFGKRLATEDPDTQNAVRMDLLYDMGWDDEQGNQTPVDKKYPYTFPG